MGPNSLDPIPVAKNLPFSCDLKIWEQRFTDSVSQGLFVGPFTSCPMWCGEGVREVTAQDAC